MSKLVDWAVTIFGQYGPAGLFIVAFAESSFFPVPPDVVLIPLCMAHPRASMLYAAVTTAASVLGAVFAYLVGARGGRPLLLKFTDRTNLSRVERLFDRFGGWALGIAAFTPVPFKVFTIASGIFQVRLVPFLIASTIGRGARFFVEAALVMRHGEHVREIIGTQFELITLIVGIAVAVAAIVWNAASRRKPVKETPASESGAAKGRHWRIRLPKAVHDLPPSRKRFWVEWGIYAIAGFVFLLIFFEELVQLAQPGRAPFLRQIDMAIMTWVRNFRNPFLTAVFTFAATLGSYPFVFASLALSITLNLSGGRRARAATLAICAIGGVGLSALTRWAYNLPGPEFALAVPEILSQSFTAQSIPVALPFYGTAAHIVVNLAHSRFGRWAAGGAVATLVTLICFSGVYMGFQWPSEAAVGTIAGAIWLSICIKLFSLTS
jgi:membrane protein YqaA with SNARE-associated domain